MENRSRINEMQMRRIVSRYELGDLLGQGSYSEVFKARHLDNGSYFAVKVIGNKVLADNQKVKQCINNELAIHHTLEPCPHIVRFYELLQTKNNCYFVYEYCDGGTLHDLLKKEGPLQQKRALTIFFQLVSGLKVLRRNNIMHRDLKPENVLINKGVFKLADFGFCKQLGVASMTRTMLGSPLYMAPEVLRGEAYTVNADIWSLGVILYEMLEGKCPFQSNSIASLISTIEQYPLSFDSGISVAPKLKRFILRCLQKDSKVRISWDDLFEEASHLTDVDQATDVLAVSLQAFPVTGKSNSRIKELHSTMAFEQPNKRSKFEIFKENYHKKSIAQPKNQQNIFSCKQNSKFMNERNKSMNRNDIGKEKLKDSKISYGELVTQHEGCLNAIKVCMELLQYRDRKQVMQIGSMLKGIHKVLERIYSRINLDDVEMLSILSMVKYEMIQVDKMQSEIQKWSGCVSQEPDSVGLTIALAEPWSIISTYY